MFVLKSPHECSNCATVRVTSEIERNHFLFFFFPPGGTRLVPARWIPVTPHTHVAPLAPLDRSYIRTYEVFQYTYNAAGTGRSIVNERRNYTAK